MADKKKKAPVKKAAAKKPAAKKKEVVIPPNKANPGSVVRTIRCDKERAAHLVSEYGFYVTKQAGDEYTVCADLPANVKYEAAL